MCKGLSKRKSGESKRLKEGHRAVEKEFRGVHGADRAGELGRGRADWTKEPVEPRMEFSRG